MDADSSEPPGLLLVLPWSVESVGGVNQVVTNLTREGVHSNYFRPVLLENSAAHRQPELTIGTCDVPALRYWLRTPLEPTQKWRTTLGFLLRLPQTLAQIARLVREHHIACINVHYPTPAALHFRVLQLLARRQYRLVLSFHGMDIQSIRETQGLKRLAWKWLIGSADNIVACSHALARDITAFAPHCRSRLVVIHNGVDPETLTSPDRLRQPPPELIGRQYVLNVATFEHKKGQDVLIRAFASLRSEFPTLSLVLVGRETPYLADLRQLAVALGVEDSIVFATDVPHERIPPYFANASAFCLPSRAEPFGIVLLEAALFRIPVVATTVGGISEIVRDGEDGILVPPEDPAQLARALSSVLTECRHAHRRASSLHERVLDKFTWQSAATRYRALIQ